MKATIYISCDDTATYEIGRHHSVRFESAKAAEYHLRKIYPEVTDVDYVTIGQLEKTWKDSADWEFEIIGAPAGPDGPGGVSIVTGFPASLEAGFETESLETLNEIIAFLESLRGCFTAEAAHES
jgi:hypothetical protein